MSSIAWEHICTDGLQQTEVLRVTGGWLYKVTVRANTLTGPTTVAITFAPE